MFLRDGKKILQVGLSFQLEYETVETPNPLIRFLTYAEQEPDKLRNLKLNFLIW